jgi:CheY-like chemotaxis protein
MDDAFPILIAEDDENDALILKRALGKAGFTNPVHISPDGAEVMQYLKGEDPFRDRVKYRFPRMVITDLKMPGVDGFQLLEWLQTHPECNVIPRLVLSASKHEQDIKRAYQLGVNSYLVKPSTFERLVEMLQLLFAYWQMCEKPPIPPKC